MGPKKRDAKAASKEDDSTHKFIPAIRGDAEVDKHFHSPSSYEVYKDEAGNQYCSYLMKNDLQANNNKFYVIQALKNKSDGSITLFTRYGRVGEVGVTGNESVTSANVLSKYEKKFKEKTKAAKGYLPLKMKTKQEKEESKPPEEEAEEGKEHEPSAMPQPLQNLITFIFDKQMIEKQVRSQGFDPNKLPLNELTEDTVMEGYKYLREIEAILKACPSGDFSSAQNQDLVNFSSKFYTYIPHDFGRSGGISSHVINSNSKLKDKMDLIDTLVNIKNAMSAQKNVGIKRPASKKLPNPLDTKYANLNCRLTPLDTESSNYKMVSKYIDDTKQGYPNLRIVDLFEVEREGEAERFNPKGLDNHILMWHGSLFSNFGGILSQGLRIAPPEAPVTGYRFGKGIYFADFIGLSTRYTRYHSSNNEALLLLCEVAMGKPKPMSTGSWDSSLGDSIPKSKEYQSTFMKGKETNPAEWIM